MRAALQIAAVVTALVVAGCGGGGGGKGSLALAIGVATADYVILDLASGAIETRTAIPDLATSATWRTSKMVFRAIDPSAAAIGSAPTAFAHQPDETASTASLAKYYIAVFEMTQAQWQAIAASTPWTIAAHQAVAGGVASSDPQKPAFAITYAALEAAVAGWNGAHAKKVAIPTEAQWEHACRGGSTADFSWGSQRDETTAAAYAAVFETQSGQVGPRRVGSLLANGYGLYDMHGNVWEWTQDRSAAFTGRVRGGSWNDTLPQARCANRGADLDDLTIHALVGARLVLTP